MEEKNYGEYCQGQTIGQPLGSLLLTDCVSCLNSRNYSENSGTKDFKKLVRNFYNSYRFNREVWEHEKVHVNDRFIWVMCGEGKTGVVGMGYFLTDPHEGDDWSGLLKA